MGKAVQNVPDMTAGNPFHAIESAVKQYDDVSARLMLTQDELASERALHAADNDRNEKEIDRLTTEIEFKDKEFDKLDRRLEFYRRKAESLTGKLSLLSRAAGATYQEAMQDVYHGDEPLPEEETAAAQSEQQQGDEVASLISRLPQAGVAQPK